MQLEMKITEIFFSFSLFPFSGSTSSDRYRHLVSRQTTNGGCGEVEKFSQSQRNSVKFRGESGEIREKWTNGGEERQILLLPGGFGLKRADSLLSSPTSSSLLHFSSTLVKSTAMHTSSRSLFSLLSHHAPRVELSINYASWLGSPRGRSASPGDAV